MEHYTIETISVFGTKEKCLNLLIEYFKFPQLFLLKYKKFSIIKL